jgi:hypothetical protein
VPVNEIVATAELYCDTRELLARDLTALGIEVEFVDASDLDGWERTLARPARLVFAETLSNPQLRLLDVPAVAELAHQADAQFVVDNTFASPYAIRLASFAEVVVADDAVRVDEVERRPAAVRKGAPDLVVVVDGERVVDRSLPRRAPHVVGFVLERELRRVDADDD